MWDTRDGATELEVFSAGTDAQNLVTFPFEVRSVVGDDVWLSPAYQREVAYVAPTGITACPTNGS